MRRTAWLVVCATLLVGCSVSTNDSVNKGGGGAVDKAGSTSESPSDGAAPAGERGNASATLGEPVLIVDDAGHEVAELTIEAITPDYPCTADEATLEDPANGHFIGVDMILSAGSGFSDYENPFGIFTLTNNGRFTIIGTDGVTETNTIVGGAPAYLCTTAYNELLTLPVEAGQTYRGVVVLDSANAAGTLIWQPVLRPEGPGPGWEWTY